jgi:hypothetical protein
MRREMRRRAEPVPSLGPPREAARAHQTVHVASDGHRRVVDLEILTDVRAVTGPESSLGPSAGSKPDVETSQHRVGAAWIDGDCRRPLSAFGDRPPASRRPAA